jgi:hypothetical protein
MLTRYNGQHGGSTTVSKGVDISSPSTSGIPAALAAAKAADVVRYIAELFCAQPIILWDCTHGA